MEIDDLDTFAEETGNHIKEKGFAIQGPAYIEYGFGWEPTVTFWSCLRRIHFYYDMVVVKDGVTIELSEIKPDQNFQRGSVDTNSSVTLGFVKTYDEAWNVMEKFLQLQLPFETLPDCTWYTDTSDHDKFIPHPPNASNPANILSITKNPSAKKWNGQ